MGLPAFVWVAYAPDSLCAYPVKALRASFASLRPAVTGRSRRLGVVYGRKRRFRPRCPQVLEADMQDHSQPKCVRLFKAFLQALPSDNVLRRRGRRIFAAAGLSRMDARARLHGRIHAVPAAAKIRRHREAPRDNASLPNSEFRIPNSES